MTYGLVARYGSGMYASATMQNVVDAKMPAKTYIAQKEGGRETLR